MHILFKDIIQSYSEGKQNILLILEIVSGNYFLMLSNEVEDNLLLYFCLLLKSKSIYEEIRL